MFTGDKNLDWKGGVAKRNFVAMGNYLVNDKVVDAMVGAFESSANEILEERLMSSIEAGRAAGGEKGRAPLFRIGGVWPGHIRAHRFAGGHVPEASRAG